MWLDPAVRQDASRAQDRLRTWAEAFQVSAAASALRAVEVPHNPAAPVLAGWSAIATILSVASSALARAKGRLAEDPPSDDFSRPTRAFHRRLRLDEIDSLVMPVGEAGAVGLQLSRALFDDSSESGALVRSFERSQGALINDAPRMVSRRLRETRRHADRSTEALFAEARLAEQLAELLKPTGKQGRLLPPFRQPRRVGGQNQTLTDVLSEPVLAALYRSGIRIGELEAPIPAWRIEEPIAGLPIFLREGADDLRLLADDLRVWDPQADLERGRSAQ